MILDVSARATTIPRILYFNRAFYLDSTSGAAVAGRALMRAMSRRGCGTEVVSGTVVGGGAEREPAEVLAGMGLGFEGLATGETPALRVDHGVGRVTILNRTLKASQAPEPEEREPLLRLVDEAFERFQPDVLVTHGGDSLTGEVLARARRRGIATVFALHGFPYRDPAPFANVDAVIVPSRFAASYYREALNLRCTALPTLVDWERVAPGKRGQAPGPRGVSGESGTGLRAGSQSPFSSQASPYVTFVNPSIEKGVYAFARIADEMGKRRPDIPLLVVESRGTEQTLTACGLDLQRHGNVSVMSHTDDPRKFWDVTRICVIPSLRWEDQSLVAVEALVNGIPVIASDRGGLPETLGGAGVVLPLPGRLTPATRLLPTAEEVNTWVETIIRLWDDPAFEAEHRRRASLEAQRWDSEILEPRYTEFFTDLIAKSKASRSAKSPAEPQVGRIQRLATAFPWPAERPAVATENTNPGWLDEGTDRALARELSGETRLVVELGAWLGMSSRFIADHAPNAVVVSVDHWLGSPEHREQDEFRPILPTLYESFLEQCWEYRERIIPLRMTSLEGLQTVADFGLSPDLIYIDAEHSYPAVTSELELARHLFPNAVLVGDDYDWEGVARAANEFAGRHGMAVERVGYRGWKIAERRRGGVVFTGTTPGRARSVVLVPHLNGIEWECEQALRQVEQAGIKVVRRGGSSAIDAARNVLISDALHDGYESMIFIDADIGFDPRDVLRLFARPEPVLCGVYAKKGERSLAVHFADGVVDVLFGPDAPGLYPVQFAATGFLRIKADVLRSMVDRLQLPLCNTKWGRGVWPFFLPVIIPHDGDKLHYLGEDWAFSHRLGQIGVTTLADTSIRLWHWGRRSYGWEDAGSETARYRSYNYRLGGR